MADLVRERLQRLRQQRGLTLQGLAALAQVSPSQIWNIESGQRQGDGLSLAVAKRFAVALGVSLDYLAAMDATLEAVHQPAPPAPKPTKRPAPTPLAATPPKPGKKAAKPARTTARRATRTAAPVS